VCLQFLLFRKRIDGLCFPWLANVASVPVLGVFVLISVFLFHKIALCIAKDEEIAYKETEKKNRD
jgi:hypothetical protein